MPRIGTVIREGRDQGARREAGMTIQVTPQRLGTLLRPRSVALVGAADKSAFSRMAYRNLVDFGLGGHTHLVNRRGAAAHGRATVTSCTQIAEPVDLAFMMVPRAATLDALTRRGRGGHQARAGSFLGVRGRRGGRAAGPGGPGRPRRGAGRAPGRPQPPGVRQLRRPGPCHRDPRAAPRGRAGRPGVAERDGRQRDARLRDDDRRRALLPGDPRQRGHGRRRACPRLPGRGPAHAGGGAVP